MFAWLIDFPRIDPELFRIGPLAVRWYGLAYVAGITLAWVYVNRLAANANLWTKAAGGKPPLNKKGIEDLVFWATLGVIVGGRLGFVLFYGLVYNADYYFETPWKVLAVWEGGMSFHGGLLGVIAVAIWFSRKTKADMFRVGDMIAGGVPIGLFFGRLANFINGELWGRPTEVSWAMIFPADPTGLPRHPSQLYEAGLEGLALFLILRWLTFYGSALEKAGYITGAFLAGYGSARIFVEFFRDSEARILGSDHWLTMGMLLSFLMVLVGGYLIYRAHQSPAPLELKTKAQPQATAAKKSKPKS